MTDDWQCHACAGTGNFYGRQSSGVIGYLPCPMCNGSGNLAIAPELIMKQALRRTAKLIAKGRLRNNPDDT